jgi:hypothetical protein
LVSYFYKQSEATNYVILSFVWKSNNRSFKNYYGEKDFDGNYKFSVLEYGAGTPSVCDFEYIKSD